MKLRYTAVTERDEDGYYVAFVPALGPGVAAQGRTRRQALARLRGVVKSYIGALRFDGEAVPIEKAPLSLVSFEVAA